jgi:hypothetical protein
MAAAKVEQGKMPGLALLVRADRRNGEQNSDNTMLRIQRSANGEVVFRLSGRMREEDIAGLETLIRSEADGRRIVLDLKDLTLIGRDAISFLERWEAKGIALKNCADYVREWITRQRRGS